MVDFAKIAPYLSDPLVLVGFVIFLFFGLCRYLLKRGIIPPLGKRHGFRIVQQILLYGFVIGLLIIALGFGLKYRSLSEAEQRRAVAILDAELSANQQLVSQLGANLETLIGVHEAISHGVRRDDLAVLQALFPASNLRSELSDPPARELAFAALQEISSSGLDRNKAELAKTAAAGKAIVGTIDRTMQTVQSLADAERKRYVVRRVAYEAQLPILRRVEAIDVTRLPETYAQLDQVRANYDVVVANIIAYLAAVRQFFDRKVVNETSLTQVLTAERLATSILITYTPSLVEAGELLQERQRALQVEL
jgi:hypothetical protein